MARKRKDSTHDKLEALDANERARLYKRARQMRKLQQNPRQRRRKHNGSRDGWDDDDAGFESMRRRSRSLDEYVTDILQHADLDDLTGPDATTGPTWPAVVVALGPGRCRARTDAGGLLDCQLAGELASGQKTDIAVGDRVLVEDVGARASGNGAPAGELRVSTVLPRRTFLSRPDPQLGEIVERVVVANVDVVVIVVSVRTPPLRPGLIDRYLLAVQRGGAAPIICVNKLDLLDAAGRTRELAKLEPFTDLGIPLRECSALLNEGLGELRDALAGRTAVFVGHSGVGKSSLLNALDPELAIDTGAVTAYAGKGRHTTTASTLHDLAGGLRVIDTPGIRQFGVAKLGRDELRWYFEEFEAHLAGCRFGDCSHTHEPRCGVRDAVEAGAVHRQRWETYQRLMAELA